MRDSYAKVYWGYPSAIQQRTRTPMYSTRGIEAVATITELRSNTSELVEHAKKIDRGILIQKNNEPYAVLISYDQYDRLLNLEEKKGRKRK